jgi:hypothetical protein
MSKKQFEMSFWLAKKLKILKRAKRELRRQGVPKREFGNGPFM